jgi:hypothetical protein
MSITDSQDWIFVEIGLGEISEYLLSKEIYWPLSPPRGTRSLPRLTIGGLLLAMQKLQARAASPAEREALAGLQAQLDAARQTRRVAWENKAVSEFRSRMDLWQNYLLDLQGQPEKHSQAYVHEVRWRVLLELLAAEPAAPPPGMSSLAELDRLLVRFWQPGGFIWSANLAAAFPEPDFWFLYGQLKESFE